MPPLAVDAEGVGVIVAIVLGVPTLIATVFFGVRQTRRASFELKVEAFLAESCDSIWVKVINVGGAEGTVSGLEIVDNSGRRIGLPGAGERFKQFKLSADSSKEISFNAPEGRDFQVTDTVVVRWGKHDKRLQPIPTQGSRWADSRSSGRAGADED